MGSLKDYVIKRASKECWPLGGDLCGTLSIVLDLWNGHCMYQGISEGRSLGSYGVQEPGGFWDVSQGFVEGSRVTSVLLGFGVSSEPYGTI